MVNARMAGGLEGEPTADLVSGGRRRRLLATSRCCLAVASTGWPVQLPCRARGLSGRTSCHVSFCTIAAAAWIECGRWRRCCRHASG